MAPRVRLDVGAGAGASSQCTHLRPGDVLVLDNASIHNDPYFKALVHGTGATLAYNAPYSPELNPVPNRRRALVRSWESLQY
jgi:transposase